MSYTPFGYVSGSGRLIDSIQSQDLNSGIINFRINYTDGSSQVASHSLASDILVDLNQVILSGPSSNAKLSVKNEADQSIFNVDTSASIINAGVNHTTGQIIQRSNTIENNVNQSFTVKKSNDTLFGVFANSNISSFNIPVIAYQSLVVEGDCQLSAFSNDSANKFKVVSLDDVNNFNVDTVDGNVGIGRTSKGKTIINSPTVEMVNLASTTDDLTYAMVYDAVTNRILRSTLPGIPVPIYASGTFGGGIQAADMNIGSSKSDTGFTLVLTSSGTTSGWWQRVGNVVFCRMRIQWSAKSGSSNPIYVWLPSEGLPQPDNVTTHRYPVTCGIMTGLTVGTSEPLTSFMYAESGAPTIRFYCSNADSIRGDYGASGILTFSCTYFTQSP